MLYQICLLQLFSPCLWSSAFIADTASCPSDSNPQGRTPPRKAPTLFLKLLYMKEEHVCSSWGEWQRGEASDPASWQSLLILPTQSLVSSLGSEEAASVTISVAFCLAYWAMGSLAVFLHLLSNSVCFQSRKCFKFLSADVTFLCFSGIWWIYSYIPIALVILMDYREEGK